MKKIGMLILTVILVFGVGGNAMAERAGGTFNWIAPYGGDFHSLDPHISARTNDYLALINMNRGLYRWNPDTNEPAAELAETVGISDDGLVYTYQLHKNVKFHNGRNMTADDVIWSYNRIMAKETASPCARYVRIIKGAKEMEAGTAKTISGIKKIDDYTIEITLDDPIDPGFPLCHPCAAVLPKEEVEKKGVGFGVDPVGCGPFQFVRWEKGSVMEMTKFPGYFETGKPYLDKLVYHIMPEGAARDVGFRSKELDATLVGSAQYPAYQKDPEISQNMVEVAEMFTRHMGFNTNFKPFADKRVRQAINYAINEELIIKKFIKNKAYPAVSFLPTTSPAFDPDAKAYGYDVEKAKQLMKEAGYEKGFEFTCIATSNKSFGAAVVETLIPFLKKINVTIKPQLLEGAALSEKVFKTADFDAYIWSVESGPDPLQALNRWSSSNPRSAGNLVEYNNPEFDKLLDAAGKEREPTKKTELLRAADGIFKDDAPIWFFNYNKAIIAHQPWVHGIKPVAVEHMFQDFTSIWVEASSPRATQK